MKKLKFLAITLISMLGLTGCFSEKNEIVGEYEFEYLLIKEDVTGNELLDLSSVEYRVTSCKQVEDMVDWEENCKEMKESKITITEDKFLIENDENDEELSFEYTIDENGKLFLYPEEDEWMEDADFSIDGPFHIPAMEVKNGRVYITVGIPAGGGRMPLGTVSFKKTSK